jgi:GTP cyclohydrolase II
MPVDNRIDPQSRPLVAVDRAIGDLRRGLPVILADGANHALVAAAELITSARLDQLRALSGDQLRLILTHNRAATLKIRRYTPDVIALVGSAGFATDTIQALADPCLDLATPLKGPFDAERRSDVPAPWISGIRLAKLSRLLPAVMLAPLSSVDDLDDYLRVECRDIDAYAHADANSLTPIVTARVPLADAPDSKLVAFRPADGGPEHLAIIIGAPKLNEPVLTRLHSECFTGDLIGSLKCDCGEQLRGAIAAMETAGGGILLYLAQEGRGIGLINKLRAYRLQDQGFDTVEANERLGFESDERLFEPAACMLRTLGYSRVRLMTNNPDKVAGLEALGIQVVERVAHQFPTNPHNEFYLSVKRTKSGHLL